VGESFAKIHGHKTNWIVCDVVEVEALIVNGSQVDFLESYYCCFDEQLATKELKN
jgi:hypothetical protein